MLTKLNPISFAISLVLLPLFGSNVIAHHTPTHGTHQVSSARATTPIQVKIVSTDSAFTTTSTEVAAGSIEFVVANQGKVPHQMILLKLSQPIDKLPMTGNRLDELNSGTKIGEIKSSELASGATGKLMTKLTPGEYLLLSNAPGDYLAGMKVAITVK